MAPARTGYERRSNQAVINTLHTKRGSFSIDIPGARIFIIVVIILIAP
jgi:hypothetical protein